MEPSWPPSVLEMQVYKYQYIQKATISAKRFVHLRLWGFGGHHLAVTTSRAQFCLTFYCLCRCLFTGLSQLNLPEGADERYEVLVADDVM